MIGLIALATAAGHSRPQWLYIDSGKTWVARGLGRCSTGDQSPVGFGAAVDGTTISFSSMMPAKDRMWYRYPPVGYPLRLVNDGHTVGVTFPETYKGGIGLSSKATVHEMFQDANFFRVYKLQIHSPAEHLYNGERYPIEVQLIHQNPITQQTGVLSAMFAEGVNRSTLLDGIMEHGLPEHELDEVNFNTEAAPILASRGAGSIGIRLTELVSDWSGLHPEPGGMITYNGSLSEPPCETGVRWWVRNGAKSASLDQIRKLAALTKRLNGPNGNARELQQTNNRKAELMAMVDIESVEIGGEVAQPKGTVAATVVPCHNMDEFTEQEYDDSDAIKAAKGKFVTAKLEAASMRVWKSQAKSAMTMSQGMYDNAAGPVEKINLKWDVIAKQQELDLASAQEAAATAAEKTACDEAIPIVCADSTTEACTNAMAQLSGEAPATPPVTTTPGPTKSPIVDTRLGYNNKVQLPGAEAANPFSDSTAERTERIGGKFGMASGYRDLTSSLREHLVPGASVAQEVPPTTLAPEPEPESTNATNATSLAVADNATRLATRLSNAIAGGKPATAKPKKKPQHWSDYRPSRRVLLQRDN